MEKRYVYCMFIMPAMLNAHLEHVRRFREYKYTFAGPLGKAAEF